MINDTDPLMPYMRKNPLMTADEVAAFARVSVNTVYRWTKSGKLKHIKLFNKYYRFYTEDVIEAFHNVQNALDHKDE